VTAYRLRLATASDAEAICRIYNQGIEDRIATLETELRTPDERRQWLASRSARHPVIVAEFAGFIVAGTVSPALTEGGPREARAGLIVAGSISPAQTEGGLRQARPGSVSADNPSGPVGWASLNIFNPRDAYRFVADISVYVERGWRGKGVGGALLEKLTELGRTHGYHKLVLSAFPGNAGGMALYAKSGFRTVGIYREQGQLDGKWVDTIVMEKLLSA
jgi:L-amino acid N-acyltransferase YncA